MIIISNTSPLNLLIPIGEVDVLPRLYERVVIPPRVAAELSHPQASQSVRDWIADRPEWLEIIAPQTLVSADGLDPGEIAAISLALELSSEVLIDEIDGRAFARTVGLPVIGSVGVLELAANRGFISDLEHVQAKLRTQRFHITDSILVQSLERHQHFRQSQPE